MASTLLEPLVLGLSSGLVCTASCGPVLLPWLVAHTSEQRLAPGAAATTQPRSVAGVVSTPPARSWRIVQLLGCFLAGRLGGYVAFAAALWALSLTIPLDVRSHAAVFGVLHMAVAAVLLWSAVSGMRTHGSAGTHSRLPQPTRAAHVRPGVSATTTLVRHSLRLSVPLATAVLGFLTGVNVCAPFATAAVRALAPGHLAFVLAFFMLFFVGTSVWLLPFASVAFLRRADTLRLVARMTLVVLAAYYGYLGLVALGWKVLYG